MGRIEHYYAGGNTCLGFYSLFDEALQGLERLYILKGGPGTGKSSFIQTIGSALAQKGFDIQWIHCPSDNDSLDGLIVPALKLGLVDGTAPHIIEPKYPGAVEELIDLGNFWHKRKLRERKGEIVALAEAMSRRFRAAHERFAEAKAIHDEWEKHYLEAMDFAKADRVAEDLIGRIFRGEIPKEEHPVKRRLFFGAATPEGPVNFYENLTEDVAKRYIVKGRPGSGKSTMLKKIGRRAEESGLSVEYYPCAFDPNSLDMVLIPALSVAVLDGTAPHPVEATRERDEIVDMFSLCIDGKVERERAKELQDIEQKYKDKMSAGTRCLQEAKRLHDRLEAYYVDAMNFDAVNEKREEVLAEILEAAREQGLLS
ncbi:PRK06851 family protein [Bacillaceae bacterium]